MARTKNSLSTTRAERRESKKRKRMRVTGKHVFKLQKLMARRTVKQ